MVKEIACCCATVALAAACAPADEPVGREDDVAAITEITEQWAGAFERADVETAMTFVTPGTQFVPPNEPIVSGAPAIEAWSRAILGVMMVEDVVPTIDDVRVAGDWAVSRGSWVLTYSADSSVVTDTSRYVVIWERQADGAWKVVHDIWNLSRPLPSGDEPAAS